MMRALSSAGIAYSRWGRATSPGTRGVTRGAARAADAVGRRPRLVSRGRAETRPLEDFAAVIMRKDPPFDMEYVYSTYLLECAEREGARVFNRPRAIRDNNEKMAITKFAEFIAPTLVTRDAALIDAFIDLHAT